MLLIKNQYAFISLFIPSFLWLMLLHVPRSVFFPGLPMYIEMGPSSADIWETEVQGMKCAGIFPLALWLAARADLS